MEPDIMDALAEVVNIGSGHGASALSSLLGKTVNIAVPRVLTGKLQDARQAFDGDITETAGFTFEIMGDLKGSILLTLPVEDAARLLRLLAPDQSLAVDDDLGASALAETAHIVSASFLSAMANMLDVVSFQSIPRPNTGPHNAVVERFVESAGSPDSTFIGVEVELAVDAPGRVRAQMLFVPDAASVKKITHKLQEMLGS